MELRAGPAILRHWRPDDVAALVRQADDRRVWLGLRDAFPHPYGIADAERFLARASSLSPRTYFAIEVEGTVAGGIGYTLHSDVERIGAEVGYWLGVAYWGRGIATAAVSALTRLAFDSHPELRRLYAVPFSSNPASARVLAKAGYRLEGTLRQSALKDGRVLDQWMYAILREERDPGTYPAARRTLTGGPRHPRGGGRARTRGSGAGHPPAAGACMGTPRPPPPPRLPGRAEGPPG